MFGVQFFGAVVLAIAVWHGASDEPHHDSHHDDPGGGPHVPPPPQHPRTPSGTRLPLPFAAPSRVRIRDHSVRLADRHRRRRTRTPQHDPPRRQPVRRY
ncbi:MAG: hypothetical protein R2736_11285 [Solirubrobacterales bacterium]